MSPIAWSLLGCVVGVCLGFAIVVISVDRHHRLNVDFAFAAAIRRLWPVLIAMSIVALLPIYATNAKLLLRPSISDSIFSGFIAGISIVGISTRKWRMPWKHSDMEEHAKGGTGRGLALLLWNDLRETLRLFEVRQVHRILFESAIDPQKMCIPISQLFEFYRETIESSMNLDAHKITDLAQKLDLLLQFFGEKECLKAVRSQETARFFDVWAPIRPDESSLRKNSADASDEDMAQLTFRAGGWGDM